VLRRGGRQLRHIPPGSGAERWPWGRVPGTELPSDAACPGTELPSDAACPGTELLWRLQSRRGGSMPRRVVPPAAADTGQRGCRSRARGHHGQGRGGLCRELCPEAVPQIPSFQGRSLSPTALPSPERGRRRHTAARAGLFCPHAAPSCSGAGDPLPHGHRHRPRPERKRHLQRRPRAAPGRPAAQPVACTLPTASLSKSTRRVPAARPHTPGLERPDPR